jgi:hypothetical protein
MECGHCDEKYNLSLRLPIRQICCGRNICKDCLDWYAGNAIKYLSRYNKKNKELSKQIEDLNKSIHYIQLLIEKISK